MTNQIDLSITDLRQMRTGLKRRMKTTTSDQNYAVLGRLLLEVNDRLKDAETTATVETERTGLSEFERRLRERESSTESPRQARA